MFGFLKDKLKKAVDSFSKKAQEELEEEPQEKSKPKSSKETAKKKEKETKEAKKSSKEDKKKPTKKDKKESKSKEKAEIKKEESKRIEEEPEEEKEEKEDKPEEKKKTGFFGKLFGKKEAKEELEEEESEESDGKSKKESKESPSEKKSYKQTEKEAEAIELEEEIEEAEEEKEESEKEKEEAEKEEPESEEEKPKGFFGKLGDAITKKTLSEEKFEELFWELEIGLLESNIALEVIEKIKSDLKDTLVNSKISRSSIEEVVGKSLKKSIDEILTFEKIDIAKKIKEKKDKPYIIVFVGVNGSGKTTTLAKVAHYLKAKGFSVVMAAGDTFRAAAIHQLEIHAEKIGVKIIKQDYGSDSAAVAFDAIAHAKANKKDVVLVDTAGRSHANANLMDELKKVIRISKPDMTLFVGDSITGNDMVEQAREFNAAVNVDGLVLSKADVDEKGGATISATYVTKKPIVFIGTGQEYKDIEEFDKDKIMNNLEI